MVVHGMVLCYEGKWLCSVHGMRVNGRAWYGIML